MLTFDPIPWSTQTISRSVPFTVVRACLPLTKSPYFYFIPLLILFFTSNSHPEPPTVVMVTDRIVFKYHWLEASTLYQATTILYSVHSELVFSGGRSCELV